MTTVLQYACGDMLAAQRQLERLVHMDRSVRAQFGRGFDAADMRRAVEVQQGELERCGLLLRVLPAANEGKVPLGRA